MLPIQGQTRQVACKTIMGWVSRFRIHLSIALYKSGILTLTIRYGERLGRLKTNFKNMVVTSSFADFLVFGRKF